MNDIEVKVGGMSEHRRTNRAGRQVTNFTQDDDNQIVDLATLRVAYTQNTRRITKGNSSSGRHALFLNAQFRQSFFDLFDYLRVGFGFHFLRPVDSKQSASFPSKVPNRSVQHTGRAKYPVPSPDHSSST